MLLYCKVKCGDLSGGDIRMKNTNLAGLGKQTKMRLCREIVKVFSGREKLEGSGVFGGL